MIRRAVKKTEGVEKPTQKFVMINIDDLTKPDWYFMLPMDPALKVKLTNSIALLGYGIITVRSCIGCFEMIDGIKRVSILKEFHYKEVLCCNLGAISTETAIITARNLNTPWSPPDIVVFADRLNLLHKTRSFEEMANLMQDSARQLRALSLITQFDWNQFKEIPDDKPLMEF